MASVPDEYRSLKKKKKGRESREPFPVDIETIRPFAIRPNRSPPPVATSSLDRNSILTRLSCMYNSLNNFSLFVLF